MITSHLRAQPKEHSGLTATSFYSPQPTLHLPSFPQPSPPPRPPCSAALWSLTYCFPHCSIAFPTLPFPPLPSHLHLPCSPLVRHPLCLPLPLSPAFPPHSRSFPPHLLHLHLQRGPLVADLRPQRLHLVVQLAAHKAQAAVLPGRLRQGGACVAKLLSQTHLLGNNRFLQREEIKQMSIDQSQTR